MCFAASLTNHMVVLQLRRIQGCPWDRSKYCSGPGAKAVIGIIEHVLALLRAVGYLIVLQQARSQGYPWNSRTCYPAARGGHLAVLQWARSQAKAVVGIVVHVPMLLWAVTWQYCSGPGVIGIKTTCDVTKITEWPRGRVIVGQEPRLSREIACVYV